MADITRILHIIGIFIILGSLVGVGTGVQAIFSAAKERGVFANLCHANATSNASAVPCRAQEHALDSTSDLMLSFLNSVSVINGIIVDVVGGRKAAVAYFSIWSLATMMAGAMPAVGYVFAVCMCLSAWGCEGGFLSFMVYHLHRLAPGEDDYAFWTGAASGLWDLGVLLSIPVGAFLKTEAMSFFVLYAIVGAVIGAPTLAYFIAFKDPTHRRTADEAVCVDADGDQYTLLEESTEAQSPTGDWRKVVAHTIAVLRKCVRLRFFWGVTAQSAATVTFGYFYFSVAGTMMEYHGADESSVDDGKQVLTLVRGVCGLIYWANGAVVRKFCMYRGVAVLAGIQAVAVVLCAVCTLVTHGGSYDRGQMYAAFVLLMVWRAVGFCVTNISLFALLHQTFGESVSIVFGISYTIAGVTSMVLGGLMTRAVNDDPGKLPLVLGIVAPICFLCHCGLAALVLKRKP